MRSEEVFNREVQEEVEWVEYTLLGAKFAIVNDVVSFDAAEDACEELVATVGKISSSEELGAVVALAAVQSVVSEVWIGVTPSAVPNNPSLILTFSDSFPDTSFVDDAGVFPWSSAHPIASSADLRTCAYMIADTAGNNLWIS